MHERRGREATRLKPQQARAATHFAALVEIARQDLLLDRRWIAVRSFPAAIHVEPVKFAVRFVHGHKENSSHAFLSGDRQRHGSIVMLNLTLEHWIFKLEGKTLGGTYAALGGERTAEHDCVLRKSVALCIAADQLARLYEGRCDAILIDDQFCILLDPRAQLQSVPMRLDIVKRP